MAEMTRRVLVYGGRGALGSACVQYFAKQDWWITNIDLTANTEANENVIIKNLNEWSEQEKEVIDGVSQALNGNKVDAIVCVAGGWAGGKASSDDLVKNTDLMIKQSLWSSVISAKLAAKFLREGGLLALTGAKAALEPTPGMIGYGLAKASVHHLVQSLSDKNSGLPKESSVLAILPVTLDTPMNRKFMPNGDFKSWTPLEFTAELMWNWSSKPEERPKSGSLIQLITSEGQTQLIPVH